MRPYLAIIKDSFRAAMASRVLYVLLLLITLLLLAIAPLHLRETLDWRLSSDFNVRNPEQLVRRVVNDKESKKPVARIWELLPDRLKKKLVAIVERPEEETNEPEVPGQPPRSFEDIFTQQELIDELNLIIENRKFYRAEDWKNRIIPSEAEELIKPGVDSLTNIRSKRLNRLLVSTAVSPTIDTGDATALTLKYAIWEFPVPISMTHPQFAQMLTSSIPWVSLPWYFEKMVLSIGLMIAIIVTANMIPDMFEPGSLNLLLSKPISRWGLFTSKFFGGCVFIGLCSVYLFTGLWLWMGFGMGIWDRAMLLSIPLYVVVFAIYFSVSAVVGVLWRSPIVSVILTLLFWAFCFGIGSIYSPFNKKMANNEFVALLPVNGQVYATDVVHRLKVWNKNKEVWEEALDTGMSDQVKMQFEVNSYIVTLRDFPGMPGISNMITPVFDKQNSQLFTSCYDFGNSLSSGRKRMFVGKVSGDDAEFKEVGKFPLDATRIFETSNGIVVASSDGSFHRLKQPALDEAFAKAKVQAAKPKTDAAKAKKKRPGQFDAPTAIADLSEPEVELFDRIGPTSPLAIRNSNHVDYSFERDEFAVFRRGKLRIYKFNGDKYEPRATLELELGFDSGVTNRLAYQGNLVAIAFGNGKVITVDAETVEEKNEYQPESRTGIESIYGSPSGKYFGVLYRNGNLWMLDTESESKMKKAEVVGQGEVASFLIDENDHMWVCDNTDRATDYDLAANKMVTRHSPSGGWLENGFRYALKPFYRICPKPGEFYKVVSYLSSAGDSEANKDVDMNKTFEVADPWGPLWSGLLFMFVMLSIGCFIFGSRDY